MREMKMAAARPFRKWQASKISILILEMFAMSALVSGTWNGTETSVNLNTLSERSPEDCVFTDGFDLIQAIYSANEVYILGGQKVGGWEPKRQPWVEQEGQSLPPPSLSKTANAINVLDALGGLGRPGYDTWTIGYGDTILAPTDIAWVNAAAFLGTTVEGLFADPLAVRDILLNLMFQGKVLTKNLVDGNLLGPTLLQTDLQVFVDSYARGNVRNINFRGELEAQKCLDPAKVVVPNLELCRGGLTIQVINQIPLPGTCDVFPRVIDIACTTPELSLYCEALQLLGDSFGASLNLAPVDAAWRRAFEVMHLTKRQVFGDYELLRNIVNFNRSPTEGHSLRCSVQFRDGEAFIPTDEVSFRGRSVSYILKIKAYSVLERLCGEAVKGLYPGKRVVVSSKWGSARIVTPEAVACGDTGSSVYLTDEVLLPPTLFYQVTVLDIVCANPSLQLFCLFINEAGESTRNLFLNPAAQSTVFAPIDAAVRYAFYALNLGDPEKASESLMQRIVSATTLVGEGVFLFELKDGFLSRGGSSSDILIVEVVGPKWLEQYFLTGPCNRAHVLRPFSNKKGVNGVVHVLDTMLTPSVLCKTLCELLELNPVTNIYAILIYALGFEFEFCASSVICFDEFTSFAPSDIAFLELFRLYFGTEDIEEVFQYYTPFLYDVVGYHTILDVLVFTTPKIEALQYVYNKEFDVDPVIPPGIVRFPKNPENQQYFGLVNGYWDTPAFITSTRTDSVDSVKGIVSTNVTLFGQSCAPLFSGDGSTCPAKIISSDNFATNGVLQVIDRVLLWPKDPECLEPAGTEQFGEEVLLPFLLFEFSIFADVKYAGPNCSFLCFPGYHDLENFVDGKDEANGYWEGFLDRNHSFFMHDVNSEEFDPTTCSLCGPFGAQIIYSQVISELEGLVAVLYVNNIGEVRFGIVPGFSQLDWGAGGFNIRPIGLELIGPSIVASNFIAYPGERFTVLATIDSFCGIAKLYINGVLRGAALVDLLLHDLVSLPKMIEDVADIYKDAVEGYVKSRKEMVGCVTALPSGADFLQLAKCLFRLDGQVVFEASSDVVAEGRLGKWIWNDHSLNAQVLDCVRDLKNNADRSTVYLGDVAECFAPLMPDGIAEDVRSDQQGATKHALNSWHTAYLMAEECVAMQFSGTHSISRQQLEKCLSPFADLVDLSAGFWNKVSKCLNLLYVSEAGLAPGDLKLCMEGSVPDWFLAVLSEINQKVGVRKETLNATLQHHGFAKKDKAYAARAQRRGLVQRSKRTDVRGSNLAAFVGDLHKSVADLSGSFQGSFEQVLEETADWPFLERLESLRESLSEELGSVAAELFSTAPPWRFKQQPENLRDFSIFDGRGPITADELLRDSGLSSQWSWLFGIPNPALKQNTAFFENCGSALDQYSEVGSFYEFAACGFSAIKYTKWRGKIFSLVVYEDQVVYPSTCKFSKEYEQPLCEGKKACPYPSYYHAGKVLSGEPLKE